MKRASKPVLHVFALLLAVCAQAQIQNPLAEAQRLRDAGNFAEAANVLRSQLAQNPDNGDAARLFAQTLYWLKDISGARAAYDAAMTRHPEDTTLQLDYARMLAETGDRNRARKLLTPLQYLPALRADVETLLGTIFYWEGDLTQGRRHFEEALWTSPNQEEAKRQLREILTGTAPWIRVSSRFWHDNQPLFRAFFGVEAGWFATPLTELTARIQPQQYWRSGDPNRTVGLAEVVVGHYEPRARLETDLAIGTVNRSQVGKTWDWTGRAAVGFHLPKHLTLRTRIERTPYFATQSSLDTPVMVQTATGLLHWGDVRGWIGEATYQHHRYADNNTAQTAYGWILAPFVHRTGLDVQAGYGFATSNARESRFTLAQPVQAFPISDPRFNTAGRYAPYYTPDHIRTHSVLGGLRLGAQGRKSLRVDASYGVRATDNAPFLYVSGGKVVRGTYLREFSPWNIRAALNIPIRETLTLEPTAEVGRTIFYSWAAAGFQITKRLERK